MIVVPAMDIIDGKCVRLEKGDYGRKKTYSSDPLSVAKDFESAGLKRLHLVDLDGAKAGSPKNLPVLEKIASHTSLEIDFGGGVKSLEVLESVLSAGAVYANIGSVAVKNEKEAERMAAKHPSSLILSADSKDGIIKVSGWLEDGGVEVISFINKWYLRGIKKAVCTDIATDGMLSGPSLGLYEKILKETDVYLISSGGVSSIKDLQDLSELGVFSAIVGKAYYEGRITLEEMREVEIAC